MTCTTECPGAPGRLAVGEMLWTPPSLRDTSGQESLPHGWQRGVPGTLRQSGSLGGRVENVSADAVLLSP